MNIVIDIHLMAREFWSRETVLVQGAFSTMYMENTQFINVFIVCHILRVMRISFIIT